MACRDALSPAQRPVGASRRGAGYGDLSEGGALRREPVMEISKDQVVELLRSQGEGDKAAQAQDQLPDKVDPQAHADLLQKLGINPQDLLGKLGGGLGDLGGLGG